MKNFSDIDLGLSDAINYRKNRRYMDMFASTFVRDEKLTRLMREDTYFLVGDKGTGKTAYAVFLENQEYENTFSKVIEIAQTDFKIFMNLQRLGFLQLADFTRVWKIILLMIMTDFIERKDIAEFGPKRSALFDSLKENIDNYYNSAFTPEISVTFRYILDELNVNETGINISLLEKLGLNMSTVDANQAREEKAMQKFQNNLLSLERKFVEPFSRLKLKKSRFVFIDSVDIHVEGYSTDEYQTCLRGMANAIWEINTSVFRAMPLCDGFLKVVLAIRTDMFPALTLHNQANKLRDNGVVLDWRTTYDGYRTSPLFLLCNRLLSYKNDVDEKVAWDTYFPWYTDSTNSEVRDNDNSFVNCLRMSLSRPRDLISIMTAVQDNVKKDNTASVSSLGNFTDNETQNAISNYYINEARDWCLFHFSDEGFKTFMYFFQFLNGKSKFTYKKFLDYFTDYKKQVDINKMGTFEALDDANKYLQLLYDLNMICYYEKLDNGKEMFRFCYREREIHNLSPQVKLNTSYGVHYSLLKALNLGHSAKPLLDF